MSLSSSLPLFLLFVPTDALPIPAATPASFAFIFCLSVIPTLLVLFLYLAKIIYMKNRRIQFIHAPTPTPPVRFRKSSYRHRRQPAEQNCSFPNRFVWIPRLGSSGQTDA